MQNAVTSLFSYKTVRSSTGAIFHVNLSVMHSAAAVISHCRKHGVHVVATTPHCDENLAMSHFSPPCAVAVGSEADGLSRVMLASADSRMRIEMFGSVESLDLPVAAGIVLHAMAREEHNPDAVEAKERGKAAKRAAHAITKEEREHDAQDSRAQRKCTKWGAAVPVRIFTQELLKKPQPEALAVVKIPRAPLEFGGKKLILILEEMYDYFNLGPILRCAEAFGIKEVCCVTQDAHAQSRIQSSSYSQFHLYLFVKESAALALSYCKRHGVRVIATTPHCDDDLACANFSAPCAVAMGNEADGLSRELLAGADSYARIKMVGTMGSLNVAVATGIVLHAMAMRG